jgi:hypothetical protein
MSDEWFSVSEPLPQSNLAVKELGGVCCYQHTHTHKKEPRHRAGFPSELGVDVLVSCAGHKDDEARTATHDSAHHLRCLAGLAKERMSPPMSELERQIDEASNPWLERSACGSLQPVARQGNANSVGKVHIGREHSNILNIEVVRQMLIGHARDQGGLTTDGLNAPALAELERAVHLSGLNPPI